MRIHILMVIMLLCAKMVYGATEPLKIEHTKPIDSASWGDFLQWPEAQRGDWIQNFAKSYSNRDLGRLALASPVFHKLLQPLIKDRFFIHHWTSGEIKSDEIGQCVIGVGGTCIKSIAFSPGCVWAAGAFCDSTYLEIVEAETKKLVDHPQHSGNVHAVRFTADEKLLTFESPSHACIYGLSTGLEAEWLIRTKFKCPIEAAAFSLNGQFLVIGSNGIIKLFDRDDQEIKVLVVPCEYILSLSVSDDGTLIAAAYKKTFHENFLRVWDVKTGHVIKELSGGTCSMPFSVAFSPCGRFLATGWMHKQEGGANIKLFQVEPWEKIKEIDGGCPIYSINFSEDGKRLVAGYGAGIIKMFYPVSEKNS